MRQTSQKSDDRANVKRKLKELEFLVASSNLLNSTLILDRLLGVIMKIVKETLNVEAASVLLLEKEGKNLVFELARGRRDEKVKGLSIPLGEGTVGWVAKNAKPLILNEVRSDSRYSLELERKLGLKVRSSICIPLKIKGKLIGVLEAVNRKGRGLFTEDDLKIFTALGSHVATAVENSRLFSELKKKDLENKLLHKTAEALGKSLSLDEVLERILSNLRKIVHYDAAAIFVLDKRSKSMVSLVHHNYALDVDKQLRLKLNQGLVGWAAMNKRSVKVDNCEIDSRYVKARSSTCSEMVTPIILKGNVIGLFNLESNKLNAYSDEDLRLLESFAAHAAISIERARLYEEHKQRLELQRELKVARTVQEFFTPSKAAGVGEYSVVGANYPGRVVSGDYYDFFPLNNGSMAFAIADVAGKGIPASMIMASFRASVHTAAISLVSAKEIAKVANRILRETARPQDFITAFVGVLIPKTGEVFYCNAGHNPPILMGKDGRFRQLEIGGPVLGVFENPQFIEGHMKLDDSILFCYTDGLIEARNPEDVEFGIDRVVDLLRDLRAQPARSICSNLYRALSEHVKNTGLLDDVTFLVLRKKKSAK